MVITVPEDARRAEKYYHDLFFNEEFRKVELKPTSSFMDDMAEKAIQNVSFGKDGQSGLLDAFPVSCAQLRGDSYFNNEEHLVKNFMASSFFRQFSNVPEHKIGLVLEESFYLFRNYRILC